MTLRQALKRARKKRGHSMEGAARSINVSYASWWRWENGSREAKGLYYAAMRQYILNVLPEAADILPPPPLETSTEPVPEG